MNRDDENRLRKRLYAIEHMRSVSNALMYEQRFDRKPFIAFDTSSEAIAEAAFFNRMLHVGNHDYFKIHEDGSYSFVHHCATCDHEAAEARRMSDPGDEDRREVDA